MELAFTRRQATLGVVAAALVPWELRAEDDRELVIESPLPPLPADLAARSNSPAYRPQFVTSVVGSAKPTNAEIAMARAILRQAPYDVTPLAVAQYLYGVGQGTDDKAAFVREWPVRANPLIQTLFVATDTKPYGDITPWCAAFVNWCVARAKSGRADAGVASTDRFTKSELAITTNSAASGSFRCWTASSAARKGDLAVFRQPESRAACSGKGHVAFLIEKLENGDLRILGGNQLLRGSSGAVTMSRYPLSGGERGRLRFHGFRTSSALHTA